jgi:Bacterial transcription activator, effector binding domain.
MSTAIKPKSFEYVELPALRFIGIDAWCTGEEWSDLWQRRDEFLPKLDEISEQISQKIPHICAFMHHDNGEVDVVNRYVVGRFLEAGTPVPDGYDFHDLKPQTVAFAVFDGVSDDTLWQRYEMTRDRILGDGIGIPYPVGYWHGEVYFDKLPYIDATFSCGVLFACSK